MSKYSDVLNNIPTVMHQQVLNGNVLMTTLNLNKWITDRNNNRNSPESKENKAL